MNPKEKILRTELVSAGAALLCCLLLCIACFLLAGLPSASLILLAAALPLSLVILPCALTWYSGRFCWAAPIFLTLGFILIPSYFLRGYFLEIGLAGLASGLFAAAVQGFHLAARREMPCTAWAAYGGLTVLYLFVSLLDLLHDALFTGGPMAGIWIAATVCCLGITLPGGMDGRAVCAAVRHDLLDAAVRPRPGRAAFCGRTRSAAAPDARPAAAQAACGAGIQMRFPL